MQASAAFDPETGLADPASIYTIALAVLTAAALAVFLVFNLIARPSGSAAHIILQLNQSRPAQILMLLSGMLMAVSGGVSIYKAIDNADIIAIVFAALTIISGVVLMVLVGPVKRAKNADEYRALSLIPVVWIILITAAEFRNELSNPVITAYVYTILALAAALPVLLQAMGIFHNRGIYKLGPFTFLAAVYFNLVTAATGVYVLLYSPYIDRETSTAFLLTNGMSTVLLTAAIMLYSLAVLWASAGITEKWRFSELKKRRMAKHAPLQKQKVPPLPDEQKEADKQPEPELPPEPVLLPGEAGQESEPPHEQPAAPPNGSIYQGKKRGRDKEIDFGAY